MKPKTIPASVGRAFLLTLLLCAAIGAFAQTEPAAPTVSTRHAAALAPTARNALAAQMVTDLLDPANRADPSQKTVQVTIKADGHFGTTNKPKLGFNPPDVIMASTLKAATDGNTATATFTIANNAWGIVYVTLTDGNFAITQGFDTGVYCLEALEATGCALRFEMDTSAVTGSSSQTDKSTVPNIMAKLDFQWAKAKDTSSAPGKQQPGKSGGASGFVDRLTTHLFFNTGYTQTTAATKLQPVAPNGTTPPASTPSPSTATTGTSSGASTPASTPSTTPCPGTAPSSGALAGSTPCMAATPQQAFVAEAGGTLGWVFGEASQGTTYEFGIKARGSFQDLVQSNQIMTSGGVSYLNVSANNPRTVIGIYEAVARFRIGAIGHNTAPALNPMTMDTAPGTTGNQPKNAYVHNTSDFLVIEAGYQNNSGLNQLSSDPKNNTRNRFVGRFYLYPPLPGTNKAKPLIGMEYSGGINGGPKVVQLYFGLNANPAKLFAGSKPSSAAPAAQ